MERNYGLKLYGRNHKRDSLSYRVSPSAAHSFYRISARSENSLPEKISVSRNMSSKKWAFRIISFYFVLIIVDRGFAGIALGDVIRMLPSDFSLSLSNRFQSNLQRF